MPKGGRLIFFSATADRHAVLDITDTAPDSPRRDANGSSRPYYTSKQHGTGLGLAIAQFGHQRSSRQRSRYSAPKDVGTTFHIEFARGGKEQEQLAANERE